MKENLTGREEDLFEALAHLFTFMNSVSTKDKKYHRDWVSYHLNRALNMAPQKVCDNMIKLFEDALGEMEAKYSVGDKVKIINCYSENDIDIDVECDILDIQHHPQDVFIYRFCSPHNGEYRWLPERFFELMETKL